MKETERLQELLNMPFLEVVLENSSACIILAEAPSGKILYINDAVRTFRGPTEAELDGITLKEYVLSWRDLFPDGTPMKSEEMPLARAILNDEVICNEEVIVELDNGEWRWALASASPIKDSRGNTVAGIVSWMDITDYKQQISQAMEEILMLRKKDKENIYRATVFGTQHILNNLLNQALLVKLEMKRCAGFSATVADNFDHMLKDASSLVDRLSSVKEVEEDNIKRSVK